MGHEVVGERRLTKHLMQLLVGRPHLLQADDVGVGRTEPVKATSALGGTDPIDIRCDDGEHGLMLPDAFARI